MLVSVILCNKGFDITFIYLSEWKLNRYLQKHPVLNVMRMETCAHLLVWFEAAHSQFLSALIYI